MGCLCGKNKNSSPETKKLIDPNTPQPQRTNNTNTVPTNSARDDPSKPVLRDTDNNGETAPAKKPPQKKNKTQDLPEAVVRAPPSEHSGIKDVDRAFRSASNYTKDDFERINKLGQGAFGAVYLVRNKRDANHESRREQTYAMKILEKRKLGNRPFDALIEYDAMRRCRHPNVIQLHTAFTDEEAVYFVMECYAGGTMLDLLASQPSHRFTMDDTRMMAAQLYLALKHVHQQRMMYRDLKPENLMFSGEGRLVLVDFGLAKLFEASESKMTAAKKQENAAAAKKTKKKTPSNKDDENSSSSSSDDDNDKEGDANAIFNDDDDLSHEERQMMTRSVVGTRLTMAPEIVRRTRVYVKDGYTQACDWWSFGVLIYRSLYAEWPFGPGNDVPAKTYENRILRGAFDFPTPEPANEADAHARDLIRKLMVVNPEGRLTDDQIPAHPFFKGVPWDALNEGAVFPPSCWKPPRRK